jgi:hypothetical protein
LALLGASGLQRTEQISREHIHRRVANDSVKTYAQLFPVVEAGSFLRGEIVEAYRSDFFRAQAQTFEPHQLKAA